MNNKQPPPFTSKTSLPATSAVGAKFYKPPNVLKQKVGTGGLASDILERAQRLLEDNKIDFNPMAEHYLDMLRRAIDNAYNPTAEHTNEEVMTSLIAPIMQLKANGSMFHYPLISRISQHMILFLEELEEPQEDLLEILHAYYTTIRAVLASKIKNDGGEHGEALYQALASACKRYLEKHKIER